MEGMRELQAERARHHVDRMLVDAVGQVGAFFVRIIHFLRSVAGRPVGVFPPHAAGADVETVRQVLDLGVVGKEAADLEVVALEVASPVGFAPRGVAGTVEVALGVVAIVHRVYH